MSDDEPAFLQRYMGGWCDALAIAVSTLEGRPIATVHIVHHGADGRQRTDPDYVHAMVLAPDGQYVDAKGKRPLDAIVADFQGLIDGLRAPEDVRVGVALRTYDDAGDFINATGCNPEPAPQALLDLAENARLVLGADSDPDRLRLAMSEIECLIPDGPESIFF